MNVMQGESNPNSVSGPSEFAIEVSRSLPPPIRDWRNRPAEGRILSRGLPNPCAIPVSGQRRLVGSRAIDARWLMSLGTRLGWPAMLSRGRGAMIARLARD
jgi:hypothetical protein